MQFDSLIEFCLENRSLIALGGVTYFSIYYWIQRTFFTKPRNVLPKMLPQIKSHMVVYLFQFAPVFNGKNGSPFCLKLESYLKWNGIPFEVVKGEHYEKNPKRKLPVIELNGEAIPDSTFIIQHLKTKFGDPDSTLSPSDSAAAIAFQRLIEDHLYYAIVYFRWIYPSSWSQWYSEAFKAVPGLLRPFIGSMVRKNVMDSLWGQGFGRLTESEILKLVQDDLDALSAFLGTKKFFFGNEPHTIDCILYAALGSILEIALEGSPLLELTKKYTNLVQYTERFNTFLSSAQKKND